MHSNGTSGNIVDIGYIQLVCCVFVLSWEKNGIFA